MKPKIQLHPLRSLALLLSVFALVCGLARAQAPVATQLDVYFGETKLLPVDHGVDSFTVTPDNILKVDKVDGAPNQLSILGIASGNATLTIKSGGLTLVYDISVSPAPERLYINVNESKRLTFRNPVDDFNVSQSGIVRVTQPDSNEHVLLVDARDVGKTTLTVYSKNEIYRYFISTFDNRGADVLEIENAFSAKGYRSLTIDFDKDQAIISGTVPTQEELDDAVRIVRQFTKYVEVKATLGQAAEQSEYSTQEQIIINNIQRIANVKGLVIKVKFPMPTVIKTSTYQESVGDYVEPTTTTTPQGGTVRGTGFAPPTNQQTADSPLSSKPKQQNHTQTVTTTENTSVPEKIFLYGDLDNDLDEARVIRVARTFCPFIVSFLTVKDPIQIRTQIRFLQITDTDERQAGVTWSSLAGGAPSITLNFSNTSGVLAGMVPGNFFGGLAGLANPLASGANNSLVYGLVGTVDAEATLSMIENLQMVKLLRQSELFLTNGQPGWYSEGEVRSYVSSSTTTVSTPPVTTQTASAVFLGVNMDISPLNLVNAGGVEPQGQKIYGIPGSIGSTGGSGYNLQQDSEPTADKVSRVAGPIQQGSPSPFIDNTVKYVDENGMIGMNISTQLTVPASFNKANPGDPNSIVLPDIFVRTTRTRVNLRDGQSVAIDGLLDRDVVKSVQQVPFLASIPLFGNLFKFHDDTKTDGEVIVLVTPRIVRMRDPNSYRVPRPDYPETIDLARENDMVPIIKPVRYDAGGVDIRPESKDMKDASGAPTANAAPAPRASGGMQALQPPADGGGSSTAAVDNKPATPDISRQPSSAPLAPSSTLP